MTNRERQFEASYQEYSNMVYNLCLNYLLNADDAQDVTQEVFVKIYQNYSRFDVSKASLKTWIYRIAINQCLDFLKARKTEKRFAFFTSLFKPDTQEPIDNLVDFKHPGLIAEDKEALESLLKVIYGLPASQKNVIILTKIEDRPQKEVAEILNVSLKAVESLLQRAKQAILKKIKENE